MTRTMLQVSVKEIDEANTIFDELMGDKVEPHREFIEEQALSARVDVRHDIIAMSDNRYHTAARRV